MQLLRLLDHRPVARTAGTGPAAAAAVTDLDRLAVDIDRHGIDALAPASLADVARRGRALGLHPETVAVVTDPSAPAVVRARAFALIHRRLAAAPARPGHRAAA